MKKLVWLFLAATSFAQVSIVGTLGGFTGYRVPYVEGAAEAKHRYNKFVISGELRGASGRKSDTGDGFHFGTRAIGAVSYKSFDFGGGYAWAKQWTSQYEKQSGRPVAYIGWHDEVTSVEGFWIFKGTDSRNGQQGAEFRYTVMLDKHWGFRLDGEVLKGYQTDQPLAKGNVGGAQGGVVYRF